MTEITLEDGIAIVLLVIYSISLPFSVFISFRHGLAKSSGWIFLAIFCILRIISSSSQLATISQGTYGTSATVAGVTQSIGLSPLLLASLGLVSRVYNSILKSPWNILFTFYGVKVIQIPATVALILCIVGATSVNTPKDLFQQTTVQAGIIIFAVVIAILALLIVAALMAHKRSKRGERPLILALGFSLPLLTIVVMYSVAECFGSRAPGSVLESTIGSELLHLFLVDSEEVAVTLIYILTGLSLDSVPRSDAEQSSATASVPLPNRNAHGRISHRARRGDFGGGKLGLISLLIEIVSGISREKKMGTSMERR